MSLRSSALKSIGIAMALVTAAAFGQNYPNKPIRVIFAGPGGSPDIVARMVAQGISGPLGESVIVDPRPSNLIGEIAAQAAPDGYTLVIIGGAFITAPLLQKMPYDTLRDFAPISSLVNLPAVLVIHPSVAANNVKELIALAKAKPGALNYGASGVGASTHLSVELFKAMAGVNIVRIPYSGAGQDPQNALLAGEVQMMINNAVSTMPHIKAGKLKALAVTSAQPSTLLPDLPTVAATVPGYEATAGLGILAPAGTPAPIITRLNQEIVRALNKPEIKANMVNVGAEVATNSPEQFAAAIKSDVDKWGKVIKDAGIKIE